MGGATATGKTGLAIRLALAIGPELGRPVEIVSADSRQVYRGLDIGTAKATREERAGIVHHGLDLVDPDEPFSVADFVTHAGAVLADLAARGGIAILAGGTGLYLRAVTRRLDPRTLPSDPVLRARLRGELAADGLPAAVERLRVLAPTAAARIDLANPRRVERALEIATLRGDAPLPSPGRYAGPLLLLGLAVEPATLRDRIATRARQQFAAGLAEEAAELRRRFDPSLPAFSAIGYREAWAVLDGTLTREAAIDLDAARNVAFARRQRTWFRSEPGITWLDATGGDPTDAALELARPFLAPAFDQPGR
ncbi:MAG TPA: tRNA (adenosine(37)-N6)-dimethylallyltransferase MiaA [Candidatus Limnocylindrales bacterium]